MAYYETTFYCNAGDQSTTGYYSVAKRASGAAVVAGQLCRQFTAPAVNSERVFICIIAGTTAVATDATWVLTRGAKTVDGTATWMEVTGIAAVNGDKTNTVNWTQAKAIGTPTLGTIIQRNSGTSYQICTTAGTLGAAEPAFSDTAGVTTTETSATTVWTSLGVVTNFTGGQAPHARLANACATNWFAAGNTIYVGDNHAETQGAAITITPALSTATMGKIICHNHSGSYPPTSANITTGATISTTAGFGLTFNPSNGGIYVYGIAFQAGVGSSTALSLTITAVNAFHYFDNCIFKVVTTFASTTASILMGSGAGTVLWNNCTVYFGATLQYLDVRTNQFIWQNTGQILASGSAVPSGLMAYGANGHLCTITMEALDLSQLTGTLDKQVSTYEMGNWLIKDCKLNAAMTNPVPQAYGQTVQVVRSDSSGTAYKSTRYQYEGTETTEVSITRVSGASDPTGQAQSRKIVTTANAQWLRPFRAEPYAIWNPRTAANVIVTVCGTINAGALPNNDDIWLEVEYLGSSASPLGTIVTTTKSSVLAANAAVASDSSTWTTPPFTTWNPLDIAAGTLSNTNLTATGTANTGGVRGINALSAGKYYLEYVYTSVSTNSLAPGIALASGSLTSPSAGTAIIARSTGLIVINNVTTGVSLGIINTGNTVGVAVDFTNQLIWFRIAPSGNWNNSGTANPATGTGGLSISSISSGPLYPLCSWGISDVITANFGVSAFTGSVPSGFTAGFPGSGVFTPFKLTTTLSSPQPGLAGYIHVRPRVAKPSMTVYLDPQVTLS